LISIVGRDDKIADGFKNMFCRLAEAPDNTDEAREFTNDKEVMGETPDRWNRKGIRIEGKGLTRVTRRE
jgi:hypothetical protein